MESEHLAARGNVLIIADPNGAADRLREWVAAAGEAPVLVGQTEARVYEAEALEQLDLVVTDLDTDVPDSREMLEHLLEGELLFGVPQLHLFRNRLLRDELAGLSPDVATVSADATVDADDFQVRVQLAAEIGRMRRELSHTSLRDELTGLYNRRFVFLRIDQEVARARRQSLPLSLALLEVDRLREINEHYGLGGGDEVLRHVGELLGPLMRRENDYGRWGERTFAALLAGTSRRGATVFANTARRRAASAPVKLGRANVSVTLSAGVASCRGGTAASPSELLRAAEHALDDARRRGGDCVHVDDSLLDDERQLVVLADDDADMLDAAEDLLSCEELEVVSLASAEALLQLLDTRRPDLLVLGLNLAAAGGEGTGLVELVRAKVSPSPLPIVGLAEAAPVRPGPRRGRAAVDRFLTKPFSVDVLRSVARDLLEQAQRGAAERV